MLDVAVVLSLLMLVGVTVAGRFPNSRAVIVTWVVLLNGMFCLGAILWPVVVGGLLMIGAVVVWPPMPGRRAAFHLASAGAIVCGYLAVVPIVWSARQEYARLRAVYPFEGLDERLLPRPPGTPPVFEWGTLAMYENDFDERARAVARFNGRNALLRRLHEEQTELFVNSVGFGHGRMVQSDPTAGNLGEREPDGRNPSSEPSLESILWEDVADFADPARWGYRRGDRVAGFLPHVLSRTPGPAKGWAVERVELLGLLLAPDPRVYVSESLPRMTEMRAVTTRHPDGFESPALAQLRAGDELVHDGPAGRLLGAVRAARQCLACHGGDRGELLGAFSYRLRPR